MSPTLPPPWPGSSLPRPAPVQIVPPRTRRPQTASAKARLALTQEVGELGDEIDNFETMRKLTIAEQGLPEWDDEVAPSRKSWAERKDQVEHEIRMEALAERLKGGAQRPTRGSQYDLEPCCRRPVAVRPQSAPSRPLDHTQPERLSSARSELMLQFWLDQHRAVIEQHSMAIRDARLEKERLHEDRTQARHM